MIELIIRPEWKAAALEATLLIFIAGYLIWIFRQQRKNPLFKISDLVTGDNGRLSSSKFAQFTTFLVTTWVLLYVVVTKELTEWLFVLYMGVWSGSSLVNKWISRDSETYSAYPPNASDTTKNSDSSGQQQPPIPPPPSNGAH